MEKYLIFRAQVVHNNAGEPELKFKPLRFADTPVLFDPEEQDQDSSLYSHVKLTGEGLELKLLENIVFPEPVVAEHLFDEEEQIEQEIEDDKLRGEVPDNQSGIERAVSNR